MLTKGDLSWLKRRFKTDGSLRDVYVQETTKNRVGEEIELDMNPSDFTIDRTTSVKMGLFGLMGKFGDFSNYIH